jgi:excinuclease ABC subunit C
VQRPDLTRIPAEPGVYRFSAADGRVLYIGKAARLRQRVTSYFGPLPHPRTRAMMDEAEQLDWLVCASEAEALLVEASLIRELQPPYNIRLRDGDGYPYLALTEHPLPRVMVWHGPARGVRRFGPYPSPSHARALRDVVEQVWGVRPCTDAKLGAHQRLGRPCLLADLGRCAAPCVDPQGYDRAVAAAAELLDGKVASTVSALEDEMAAAAADRAFEAAASVRDRLEAVRALTEHVVPTAVAGVVDALGVALDDTGGAAQLLRLRDGSLRGCPTVVLDPALHARGLRDSLDAHGLDAPAGRPDTALVDTALVDTALVALYGGGDPAPLVLVPANASPETIAALSAGTTVRVRAPRTSSERALLTVAADNAAAALERARLRRATDPTTRRAELAALAEALGLAEPPLRIECLDISHFAGTGTVAALSVLEEGHPRPALYRRFRLKERNDDPAAMAEVVARRVTHLRPGAKGDDPSLASRPGLLLIDGGPTQLAAAAQACADAGVEVPLAALAKRLEELWCPGASEPVRLPADSPALYVVQRARDEAHRSALAYQRRRRRIDVSALDGIPGLGPRRRERLLQAAGSLEALRGWPRTRLAALSWLPAPVADAVHERLRV